MQMSLFRTHYHLHSDFFLKIHPWELMTSIWQVVPELGPRYTKPGLQAEKKNEHTIIQKEYSDDRLPPNWMQYNQTVRHCGHRLPTGWVSVSIHVI